MAKIVTACNSRWFGRILPYLDSLKAHSQIPPVLVTVGFNATYPGVETVELPRSENAGAPIESESPQHGSWLKVVEGKPDDIVIFTDGDIVVQRPFTQDEIKWLFALPENTVACGYNSGPAETLTVEAGRLFPRFPIDSIGARFGLDLDKTPCYNIGVIAARRSTFQRIYDAYMPLWKLATDALAHPARQQWLVCVVFALLGLQVKVTPYSFHANGHYGIPPGCIYADGSLYHGNELVLFRHRL